MNIVNQYYKLHSGFHRIWDDLRSQDLINKSILRFIIMLHETKDRPSTIIIENSSLTFEITVKRFTISLDKSNLILHSDNNSFTFNLKNIIINDNIDGFIKFKNHMKVWIY